VVVADQDQLRAGQPVRQRLVGTGGGKPSK